MPLELSVLPRRLAPIFPSPYSSTFLRWEKVFLNEKHFGSLYHTFVHCKGFAPAAPRRARTSISVSFSGLPLSGPLRIFGLVSLYLTNNLIRRRLILRPYVSEKTHFSCNFLLSFTLSLPRLSSILGQIIDVLLSLLPVSEDP